jgi:hypothetical protein
LPFEGPIQGYVANYLHRHLWKVEDSMDWDDCMVEAWIVYDRCAKRYPEVEARHFMALFKTAWTRRFTDLARETTKHRATTYDPTTDQRAADTDNAGYVCTLVRQAPADVRMVLSLLVNAPSEVLELLSATWASKGAGAANRLVCRWLALTDNARPLDRTREYFDH